MKELRIEIPVSQNDVLSALLDSYELMYSRIDLANENQLYIVKVQANQTNNLLHELRARGVGEIFGNISVFELSLFVSSKDDKSKVTKSSAANVEEILANIESTAVLSWSYLALVVLSGALAAFGLLSDSIVIIIGSMIVAPLLGPVALTSIGVLLPGRSLFRKGFLAEFVGIGLTIAIGFAVGIFVLSIDSFTESQQMIERAAGANAIYNIFFAVISGLAAGLIISKGQSLSMVGVAIAASLAPPAANIGLYLSLFEFQNASLAGLLLIINILAINASCSLMFIFFRLPSKAGVSKRRATKTSRNMKILTFIVVSAFLTLSYFYIKLF